MMLMLAIGLRQGVRGTLPAMLGALSVVLMMLVASALGLGLVLQQSPEAFLVIKALGASYLAWLGLQLMGWRGKGVDTAASPAAETSEVAAKLPPLRFWQALVKGSAVAGSNPKAILFAAAYFPQFIDGGQAAVPQLYLLLPTFVVLEVACYLLYASAGQRLAAWFAQPRVLRRFNLLIGAIFLAFGVLLLVS